MKVIRKVKGKTIKTTWKKAKKVNEILGEVWKEIPYTGGRYHASNMGRVKFDFKDRWGRPKNNLLRIQNVGKTNVKRVTLMLDGRRHDVRLNRAVLMAFGNIEGSLDYAVKHRDNNPQNVSPDNMEWITRKQEKELKRIERLKSLPPIKNIRSPRVKVRAINRIDRVSGEPRKWRVKLSNEEVLDIVHYFLAGYNLKELAEKYSVEETMISRIVSGEVRSVITGIIPVKKKRKKVSK